MIRRTLTNSDVLRIRSKNQIVSLEEGFTYERVACLLVLGLKGFDVVLAMISHEPSLNDAAGRAAGWGNSAGDMVANLF